MRELGLRVIRVPAADVFKDVDAVAAALVEMCAELASPSTTQLR